MVNDLANIQRIRTIYTEEKGMLKKDLFSNKLTDTLIVRTKISMDRC